MNWQQHFSERARHLKRSSVRELLKLTTQPAMISFAGGLPDPALFPFEETRQAAEAILRRNPGAALQYGETEGLAELRDWVAARFSRPHLRVRRENVLIVSGSQQAIDLLGKVFLEPGDEVLVENPTYLALLSAWRLYGANFVPADRDANGALFHGPQATSDPRRAPKLAYVIPNFQNPQGTTLTLEERHAAINFLRTRGIPVVEDDPYGELRYEGEALPSLLELEAGTATGGALETRVIRLGTFSKILAPGLRVGWVIAAHEVIERLVQAKQSADLHTSTYCQRLVLELVRNGVIEQQLPKLRAAYREKRDAMLGALEAHFSGEVAWTQPQGGMFLFLTLLDTMNAETFLRRALARKVAFVPGADFHLDGQGGNTLRLNFSHPTLQQIAEGIRRLRVAWDEGLKRSMR